jgi:hypothetical protein
MLGVHRPRRAMRLKCGHALTRCQYIVNTSRHLPMTGTPETGSTCVAGPITRTAEGTKQWLCGSARPQVRTCP